MVDAALTIDGADRQGRRSVLTPYDRPTVDVPDRRRPSPPTLPSPPQPVFPDAQSIERAAARIWAALPFAGLRVIPSNYIETIGYYEASLRKLDERRAEVDLFLRSICEANLELEAPDELEWAPSRQRALDRQLEEMLSRVAFAGVPVGTALVASLALESPETVHARLQAALWEIVRQFSVNVFAALHGMAQQKLIGVIEWHGGTACEIHYFQRRLTCEVTAREFLRKSQTIVQDSGERLVYGDWAPVTRETQTVGHAWHAYHVIGVQCTTPRDSDVVIPLLVQKMLACVPSWLDESLRIVGGKRIRGRIIERYIAEETAQHWDTVIHVREKEVFHIDPGVVLGPYVLTGWGDCEINAELTRRRQDPSCQKQRRRGLCWLILGVPLCLLMLTCSALLMLAGLESNRDLAFFGVLLAFSTAVPARGVLRAVTRRRRRVPDWTLDLSVLSAAGVCWSGCLFFLQGFQAGSTTALGFGLISIALTVPLAWLARGFWKSLSRSSAFN